MDLDETWQVGLRPEKTKPCTFPRKSRCGFWRERENMGRRGDVFVTWTTHHFCHFPWIDFRQTSYEHMSRWWLATHGFIFQKSFHYGIEFAEKPSFRATLFMLSLRVTGNVLRHLHFSSPWCTSHHRFIFPPWLLLRDVSFSSYPPPKLSFKQWRYLNGDTVAPPGERRDTTE